MKARKFKGRYDMIYLDNSATMKPCEKAIEAAVLGMEKFGNPSSPHALGTESATLLRNARKEIAEIIKCEPSELYFTSGGSESNNTAIIGLAMKNSRHSKRIVTTNSEHPSVAEPVAFLEKNGFEVIRLSTKGGKIDLSELREALSQKTALVTVMQVNNETGAVYDLKAVREEINRSGCGAFFHADCVQSFMKVNVNFAKYCDAASISAHKIGGIKGCGGLYLKKGVKPEPFVLGGGQESGFRSGTENIPGILAFAAAAKAWSNVKKERNQYILALKEYLKTKLTEVLGNRVALNVPENSVCCLLNFSIPGVKSETVINALSADGICISASSACSTHAKENAVLAAFGLAKEHSESALRVGIAYFNTKQEIDILCDKLGKTSERLLKIKM